MVGWLMKSLEFLSFSKMYVNRYTGCQINRWMCIIILILWGTDQIINNIDKGRISSVFQYGNSQKKVDLIRDKINNLLSSKEV